MLNCDDRQTYMQTRPVYICCATKKYFIFRYKSRMHPYETERNEVKTIKTEDIDVETQKNGRTTATPGDIKRDTTLKLPGGKAVVRMITNRLKDCSYVTKIIPEDEENGEGKLTLGQRLALKYQMKEKPKKQKTPSPPSRTRVKDTAAATTATAAKADDSGEESEWTWETCSSSEAEDWPPPKNDTKKTTNKNVPNATASKTTSLTTGSNVSKTTLPSIAKTSVSTSITTSTTSTRPSVAYTRSNTTSLCTTTDEGLPSSLRSSTKSNIESEKSSVLPYSSIYLRKDPPKIDIAENLPTLRKSSLTSTSSLSRPISWAGSQSYLAATPQTLRLQNYNNYISFP